MTEGQVFMEFMISNILIECFDFPRSSDEKLLEDFNWSFIQAWRTTHNYKQWRITSHSGIEEITSGLVWHSVNWQSALHNLVQMVF